MTFVFWLAVGIGSLAAALAVVGGIMVKASRSSRDDVISLNPKDHGAVAEPLLEEIERSTNGFTTETELVVDLVDGMDPGALIPMLAFKTGMMIMVNVNDEGTSMVLQCQPI